MRWPHLLLGVAFFSGWVASWSPTNATGPLDLHLFRRPTAQSRPFTPAYSDEKTRDRRGEAEFLYRLRPSFAPDARLAIVDRDKSTQDHGTPPALLRCELAAVGYRQVDFVLLARQTATSRSSSRPTRSRPSRRSGPPTVERII
jgi:hypothetical protein